MGHFDDAERVYIKCLNIQEKCLAVQGNTKAKYIMKCSSINNIGLVYFNKGRYA